MTTKYGVFGETQAMGIGDPFVDTVKPDPRDHGLNFKVATCKVGKNNDACFDKFLPLYQGEKYIDPLRLKLQMAKAGAERIVADRPFKVASPMKDSACPGDFIGTIGGKVEYMAGTVDVKKKKGEIPRQPKNIVTATPKKGGFGFMGTTLSERQGARGVAGEYEYWADPIHEARRIREKETAPSQPPFRPIGPPKRGGPGTVARHFGGRIKGAVGEFEWRPRPEPPVSSRAPGAAAGGEAAGAVAGEGDGAPSAPFRPATFPKQGRQATFSGFPEYVHDPEEPKAEARAWQRKAERGHLSAHAGGAWRLGGGVKTDATRSIVRMNL